MGNIIRTLLICISSFMLVFFLSSFSGGTGFLGEFYNDYVFGKKDFTQIAKEVCSSKLLKYLQDNYEYDCESGECYAIEEFRTGNQDGPSDVSKIEKIISLGNNWYGVNYLDMGMKGVTYIHFVEEDGKLKMDEISKQAPNGFPYSSLQ